MLVWWHIIDKQHDARNHASKHLVKWRTILFNCSDSFVTIDRLTWYMVLLQLIPCIKVEIQFDYQTMMQRQAYSWQCWHSWLYFSKLSLICMSVIEHWHATVPRHPIISYLIDYIFQNSLTDYRHYVSARDKMPKVIYGDRQMRSKSGHVYIKILK